MNFTCSNLPYIHYLSSGNKHLFFSSCDYPSCTFCPCGSFWWDWWRWCGHDPGMANWSHSEVLSRAPDPSQLMGVTPSFFVGTTEKEYSLHWVRTQAIFATVWVQLPGSEAGTVVNKAKREKQILMIFLVFASSYAWTQFTPWNLHLEIHSL